MTTTGTVPQTVLFPDLVVKPLVAKFNQQQARSDSGAVLPKTAERVYGLVRAFAQFLSDKRAPEKIRQTLADPICGQRIFGIACGYPLRTTPPQVAGRPRPDGGRDMASQSTLSRLENAVGGGSL